MRHVCDSWSLVTASIISGHLDPPGFSFASSVNKSIYCVSLKLLLSFSNCPGLLNIALDLEIPSSHFYANIKA